jgi:hypothetical protein
MKPSAILTCSLTYFLLGFAPTSRAGEEMLPAPGFYHDQFFQCIWVVSRDVVAREFTFAPKDLCKPGHRDDGSEEKTFRCVSDSGDWFNGFWGKLEKGSFTIQGDSVFLFEGFKLHSQQTSRYSPYRTFVPDTDGICDRVSLQPPRRIKPRD